MGCNPNSDSRSTEKSIKGSDGIIINFIENNPQDRYIVSEDEEPITIALEMRNKGSFPKEDDKNDLSRGQVYVSGFDRDIIQLDDYSKGLDRNFLPGVSRPKLVKAIGPSKGATIIAPIIITSDCVAIP